MHEPLWSFRLRQRLFAFAGRQRCPDRGEATGVFTYEDNRPLPDTWDIGPDGNRTCSYCGSIHPADLMKIARLTLTDDRYGIKGTDKSYKVYVKQPGVRNASEGAFKFYMAHAPKNPSVEEQDLFKAAVHATTARWQQRMKMPQPTTPQG